MKAVFTHNRRLSFRLRNICEVANIGTPRKFRTKKAVNFTVRVAKAAGLKNAPSGAKLSVCCMTDEHYNYMVNLSEEDKTMLVLSGIDKEDLDHKICGYINLSELRASNKDIAKDYPERATTKVIRELTTKQVKHAAKHVVITNKVEEPAALTDGFEVGQVIGKSGVLYRIAKVTPKTLSCTPLIFDPTSEYVHNNKSEFVGVTGEFRSKYWYEFYIPYRGNEQHFSVDPCCHGKLTRFGKATLRYDSLKGEPIACISRD